MSHASEWEHWPVTCPWAAKNPLMYSRWNRRGLTKHNWNGLMAFVSVCTTRNFSTWGALHFHLFPSFNMTQHHHSFTLQFRNAQTQQEHEVCQYSYWTFFLFIYSLHRKGHFKDKPIRSIRGRFPRTKRQGWEVMWKRHGRASPRQQKTVSSNIMPTRGKMNQ